MFFFFKFFILFFITPLPADFITLVVFVVFVVYLFLFLNFFSGFIFFGPLLSSLFCVAFGSRYRECVCVCVCRHVVLGILGWRDGWLVGYLDLFALACRISQPARQLTIKQIDRGCEVLPIYTVVGAPPSLPTDLPTYFIGTFLTG